MVGHQPDSAQNRYMAYIQSITALTANVGNAGIAPFLTRFPNLRSILARVANLEDTVTDELFGSPSDPYRSCREIKISWSTTSDGRHTCLIHCEICWYDSFHAMNILGIVPTSHFDQIIFDRLRIACKLPARPQLECMVAGYIPRHIEFYLSHINDTQGLLEAASSTGIRGLQSYSLTLNQQAYKLLYGLDGTPGQSPLGRVLDQIECPMTGLRVNTPLIDALQTFASVAYIGHTLDTIHVAVHVPEAELPRHSASFADDRLLAQPSRSFRRVEVTFELPHVEGQPHSPQLSAAQIATLRTWIRPIADACLRLGGQSCIFRLAFTFYDFVEWNHTILAADRVVGDMAVYADLLRDFNRIIADATGRHDDPLLALNFPVRGLDGDDDIFTTP